MPEFVALSDQIGKQDSVVQLVDLWQHERVCSSLWGVKGNPLEVATPWRSISELLSAVSSEGGSKSSSVGVQLGDSEMQGDDAERSVKEGPEKVNDAGGGSSGFLWDDGCAAPEFSSGQGDDVHAKSGWLPLSEWQTAVQRLKSEVGRLLPSDFNGHYKLTMKSVLDQLKQKADGSRANQVTVDGDVDSVPAVTQDVQFSPELLNPLDIVPASQGPGSMDWFKMYETIERALEQMGLNSDAGQAGEKAAQAPGEEAR